MSFCCDYQDIPLRGTVGSGFLTEHDTVGRNVRRLRPDRLTSQELNCKRQPVAVDFSSRTISSDSAGLNDEEWADPAPIPAMLREPVLPCRANHREDQIV